MAERQIRFDALDAWRGIAALIVALFHFQAAGYFYAVPLVRHGNLAVPFFFVLSGFVITHAYRSKLHDAGDGWRFMIRRFGRLYPLHFVTLMVLVVLELAKLAAMQFGFSAAEGAFQGTNNISSLIANIFLLHAIIPFPDLSWNAASWSISTEFYTYLVFLLVYLLSGARHRLLGCAMAFVASGLVLLNIEIFHPQLGIVQGMGMAQCVFGFFTGNLTYELYLRLRDNPAFQGTRPEILATMLMVLLFWFKPPFISFDILVFGLVILLFSYEGGAVARVMRAPALQRLGELSYSIYLVHFIIFAVMFVIVRLAQAKLHVPLIGAIGGIEVMDFGPSWLMDLVALGYLITVVICATLTYRFVEVPGRRFFNRLSRSRAQPEIPTGVEPTQA